MAAETQSWSQPAIRRYLGESMRFARFFLFSLAALGPIGCTQADRDLVYRGAINDSETIELRQTVKSDAFKSGPDANFAALRISVGDGLARSGGELERHEFERAGDVQRWNFGRLEGRSEPDGQRVWVVDTAAGRVIASLDRYTGAVTGPSDPPPAWATTFGGMVLKQAP
jgi:hypothetical protein